MKTTGIVRPLDSLGRIVIPKEMRRLFDLEDGVSYLDISVIDDTIVLKKFDPDPKCVFCGANNDIRPYKGKCICETCLKELSEKSL